ncbi:carboxylesterase family protein [uncultured Microbulbifer sp.]|uniref:carboxylesterase/lipase family protein n=1 Tax=uncultured Microbulbifer sp. TaxID=348147 RepID=UPI0025F1FD53|nr:carboxylesterase family protein [uncultured Microbulbifer sp.]
MPKSSSTRINHNTTPIVQAPQGPIIGRIDTEADVRQFLGIPYALPPVGSLRWAPPQPVPRWSEPYHAFRYGMPAPQNPSPLFQVQGPNGEPPENEDCLYLNIFAPDNPLADKLPVMVWIHGGAFYLGSGCQSLYCGNNLAASGRAIVVTINYRLGALGFLRLCDISDIDASGNEGLLDQVAALNWVRENIGAFGGDPENITLFGESAGAMSIATLLALEKSAQAEPEAPLFHKAIVQSGNPAALHTPLRAGHMAEAFCQHLEQITDGKALADASTRELLRAQEAVLSDPRMEREWGHLPFKPVLDGHLIPRAPVDALRDGAGAKISVMVGSNLDEWNLFSAARPETYTLDDTQIRAQLEHLIPGPLLNGLLSHYRSRAESLSASPWPLWSRTWNLLLTDMVFTLPGLRLLQAHQGRRYHYHFAQPLAAQPLLGACHAAELGYVFGTHGDESLSHLYGGEPEPHHLSHAMRSAWLNFAECGDPGDDWPHFDSGISRRFGDHPDGRQIDLAELEQLWREFGDEQLHGYL